MQRTIDRLELWHQLKSVDGARLIDAIRTDGVNDVAHITRLRDDWDADLVVIALELVQARKGAASKFEDADTLLADVEGVQQATGSEVAAHKARRFESIGVDALVDLCCGIGGDAMALSRSAEVHAIDLSPVRAWMCSMNASCESTCADVTDLTLNGEMYHLDPARRVRSPRTGIARRLLEFEDYIPGPAFIDSLRARCPTGAVKLGPGIDLDVFELNDLTEIEIINHRGTLVQAVLWTGDLALHRGQRTATRLPEGCAFSGTAGDLTCATEDEPFLSHLLLADPALERTRLVAAYLSDIDCDASEVWPGLGVLTCADAVVSPWFTCFEIIDVLPWRMQKIRARLQSLDAHITEIRTRGRAIDPDQVRAQLKVEGSSPFTLFGLRLGRRIVAVIARPVGGNRIVGI